MAIATLSIDLVAKLANLQTGMDRASRIVEQSAGRMEGVFTRVSGVAGGVGAALAGGLGVAAVTMMASYFRTVVDGIDNLNDLADVTGSTVEKMSALEDFALRTGAGVGTVADAVLKLNKELNDTSPDSGAAQALKAIGLSADELRKIDPADALQRVAEALAGYENDANKARLVQDLFGKSVREVGPMLKDLAEAGKLNATVTTQQAAEAEKFNRQIATLQANAVALGRAIVSDVLPALNSWLGLLVELKNGPGIMASLGEALKGNTFTVSSAGEALSSYSAKIADVDKRISALKADDRPLINLGKSGRLADLEAERAKLVKFADAYRNVVNAGSAGGGRGSVTPLTKPLPSVAALVKPPKGGAGSGAAAAQSFTDYAAEISQAVARMVQDSDIVRVKRLNDELAKLDELAAAGLDPTIVASVRAKLTAQLPPVPESASESFRRSEIGATDSTNADLAATALARYNDQRERLNALLRATPSAELEQQRQDMLLLAEALERGAISQEQFMEAAQARLGNLPKELEKAKSLADELGLSFTSAFEDAVVGGKRASEVFKALEQDILRIITRKMVTEPLGNALTSMLGNAFGAGGGGGGGSGNFLASVGKFFAGFFADGGTIAAGKWGIVGEQGPELAFGGAGGKTIVPMRAVGGGGHVFNINVQAMPGASRASAMQQGEIIGRQVQMSLNRNG
jgi:hypothetical protein